MEQILGLHKKASNAFKCTMQIYIELMMIMKIFIVFFYVIK